MQGKKRMNKTNEHFSRPIVGYRWARAGSGLHSFLLGSGLVSGLLGSSCSWSPVPAGSPQEWTPSQRERWHSSPVSCDVGKDEKRQEGGPAAWCWFELMDLIHFIGLGWKCHCVPVCPVSALPGISHCASCLRFSFDTVLASQRDWHRGKRTEFTLC